MRQPLFRLLRQLQLLLTTKTIIDMALIGSLTSGVSALTNFQKQIEVIGNNVANVNTTGFKSSTARFSDSFSNLLQNSAPSNGTTGSNIDAIQIGTGVQLEAIQKNFGQGTLSATGALTDLGVAGNGFFTVKDSLNDDVFVTRAGNFRLDDMGYLVTSDGLRVQGLSDGSAAYNVTSGTLTPTAPATVGDLKIDYTPVTGGPSMNSFAIDQTGNIIITLTSGDTFVRGQVLLQNFKDPNALVSVGNNRFSNLQAAGPVSGTTDLTAADNTPGSTGLGKIKASTLELSNVDLSNEFTSLITAQRSFQAGSRIVTTSDSVLEEIINLKR